MKDNTKIVWDYIVAHDGEDFTAQDIADATGLGVKSVNGSVTSFQKKGLTERVECEVETEDGKHATVKFVKLTALGHTEDPDTVAKKDAE